MNKLIVYCPLQISMKASKIDDFSKSLRNLRRGVICVFLLCDFIEFASNSTGFSFGDLVNGLPSAFYIQK